MNGQEIRDRLLHSYERSYDIVKPSEVNGHTYDACASYHESGAKYVLSKKAELWRISCHEHAYFKAVEELNDQDVETFLTDLTEWIEPKVVREGKEVPDTRPHVHAGHPIFFCGQTGCGQRKEENPKI